MTPTYCIDETLYQYCTVRQLEVLEAINKHKSIRAAARSLGIHKSQACQAVALVKKKAALQGYSPEHHLTHEVAPGQKLRGASTLYRRGEPEPVLQWVKTSTDDAARNIIIKASVAALMDDVPRAEATAYPLNTAEGLCNVITLTDVHVGAYAWAKETGADWDLTIAERDVTGAVRHLLAACPLAGTCVIAQLGDFLHQDGLAAVTPTSGHQLDSDSRFSKVVHVAIRILRTTIDMALQRHANF